MILEEFPKDTPAIDGAVVPVGVKVLADAETPVSVLARFDRREKNLFLLESAEGGERRGRYSFLGLDARLTATVYREEVVVRQGLDERRVPHGGDPMAVLRSLVAPYRMADAPGLPPGRSPRSSRIRTPPGSRGPAPASRATSPTRRRTSSSPASRTASRRTAPSRSS